ncbi:hypothetical protein K2173_024985 [Erythroxylum novogranatense]|uniref:Uncharacterized protein n=1 Tax=Erythroxylum novogranatense TaxID=1862640 RepID=A0AAV8UCX4_9ROSI|nr:hypothetical protein K2173_024985 [Erythroxylum novogranatense]
MVRLQKPRLKFSQRTSTFTPVESCLLHYCNFLSKYFRPYSISTKRIAPDNIDKPDWAIDGIPKIEPNSDLQHVVEENARKLSSKLSSSSLQLFKIAREVLDAAAQFIRLGVTTDEIDRFVHKATIAAGIFITSSSKS